MQENIKTEQTSDKILVIGGGVGGIRAALDLAESEIDVVMIDKAHAIGGLMTLLDRTFPTNNCDLCTISPHLSESGRAERLRIMPMTKLVEMQGEKGNFEVTLRTGPRYIDLDKCTACGQCRTKFPEFVRFTPGLDPRAPTCMRYPQATPYAFSIDKEKCTDFQALVDICPAGAILPEDRETESKIKVGAVILATGADLFDYHVLDNFGGGRYPNVVSGLEYERIMSASGPTAGELVRPSDGSRPKKIAWIQCVGSRGINQKDVPYCSSVCCMYALKEAIVTKERFQDDIEATIFFMDMRTFGKDYEKYLARARNEYDVKLVRSRPHSVLEDPETRDLTVTYILDGQITNRTDRFDMVVLSTGFRISEETGELLAALGVEADKHRFVTTGDFSPVMTSREGVYVCGISAGPKDIPETMAQAGAAACIAAESVGRASAEIDPADEFPPEKDVENEAPAIGVFLCDCGSNIGDVVNVDRLVNDASALPNVVFAGRVGHGCSRDAMKLMEEKIRETGINRVVIGACSPRTHETKFQDMIRRAGLNKYLVEMANIRDQSTWVHGDLPEKAEEKASELIRMAVSSVALHRPLKDYKLPVNKDVLVVGGGVSGMNAALRMAGRGLKVFLVERSKNLGGLAGNIRRTRKGADVREYLDALIKETLAHPNIQVLTQAIIVDHTGMPGAFETGIQIAPRMHYRKLEHGAAILTTGAEAGRSDEYLSGAHDAVVTPFQLETILEEEKERIRAAATIVMIQCVGSREPENPNCSRVCCRTAVKNALRIKTISPDTQIFILYRDIRTFGLSEIDYREARLAGVIFCRYERADKPVVGSAGDKVTVEFKDMILDHRVSIETDLLVPNTGFVADDENTEDLARIFKLPRTDDNYFLEDHIKLRPLDLVPGFFVAGCAHSPRTIPESITQAFAAAGRAMALLARDSVNLGATVAKVDSKKCASCLICVRACPYGIPFINADGYSQIDAAKCHGCGICAAECPAKAISLLRFEDDQVLAKLEGLLERNLMR